MLITITQAEKIRKLRHRNLRNDQPFSSTSYKRDNESETFHLAAIKDNKIISCATFYPQKTNILSSEKAYRLRGMATDKEFRKKGVGKKIILKAFDEIKKRKGDLIWCKARLVAVDFYKKLGLQIIGEKFDIQGIGPHFLMYKNLL